MDAEGFVEIVVISTKLHGVTFQEINVLYFLKSPCGLSLVSLKLVSIGYFKMVDISRRKQGVTNIPQKIHV
jgi:hypothetical protein